jgi:ABC-type transport system involved in cytochrome c biogenesis permease component
MNQIENSITNISKNILFFLICDLNCHFIFQINNFLDIMVELKIIFLCMVLNIIFSLEDFLINDVYDGTFDLFLLSSISFVYILSKKIFNYWLNLVISNIFVILLILLNTNIGLIKLISIILFFICLSFILVLISININLLILNVKHKNILLLLILLPFFLPFFIFGINFLDNLLVSTDIFFIYNQLEIINIYFIILLQMLTIFPIILYLVYF